MLKNGLQKAIKNYEEMIDKINITSNNIETLKNEIFVLSKKITDTLTQDVQADVQVLRTERLEKQQSIEDFVQVKVNFQDKLKLLEVQVNEEKLKIEAKKFEKLAKKRHQLGVTLEESINKACEAIDELTMLDREQRTVAKKLNKWTGRSLQQLVDNYLIYKFKPYLSVLLPRIISKAEFTDIDFLGDIEEEEEK